MFREMKKIQNTFAYMYMGGVAQPRNFLSFQFPLHRREKACRVRLASRLFYAHSNFSQANFEDFFCFAHARFFAAMNLAQKILSQSFAKNCTEEEVAQ